MNKFVDTVGILLYNLITKVCANTMENKDLELIKKFYSEKLAHLCRKLFPTILEKEGLLFSILSEKFAYSSMLGIDLVGHEKEFKDYIYSFFTSDKNVELIDKKTPTELFREKGYTLYPECITMDDVLKFTPYYSTNELLCTFYERNLITRIDTHRIWFAVKDGAEKMKRENYKNPDRQDEYGTSVLSIQFSRGPSSTLSIKNRYNNAVDNPDATFSNNLDNIIPGLAQSFIETYCINISDVPNTFGLDNYIIGNDGKFYRYNQEIYGRYFCENNYVIDSDGVHYYNSAQTILADYYLIDSQNKKIVDLTGNNYSFVYSVGKIKKIITRKAKNSGKMITIYVENGDPVYIEISNHNTIIGYVNHNIKEIGNHFLCYNYELQYIDIPNVKVIENGFLMRNTDLKSVSLPKVVEMGYSPLFCNNKLEQLYLPKLKNVPESILKRHPKREELIAKMRIMENENQKE